MKARILSHKTTSGLEALVDELASGEITVRHVGYSIDPKGVHFALVLYTPGADREDDVRPAAARFIADALETGVSEPQVRSK